MTTGEALAGPSSTKWRAWPDGSAWKWLSKGYSERSRPGRSVNFGLRFGAVRERPGRCDSPDHFGHRTVQTRADAHQCDLVAAVDPVFVDDPRQHGGNRCRSDVA